MKLVKKWLFPALTCLIVAGAAVLPPLVSQARDVRLLGQVHAELLDAKALPAAQTPTLLDRMALYASRYSSSRTILSSEDYAVLEDSQQKELAQSAQELLTEAKILPSWIFEEEPFDDVTASRLLLWDPAGPGSMQEPSVFWNVQWQYYTNKSHQKSVRAVLDAETGLPIGLYIHDTNMSQWLAYDTADLRALVERYADLLALEVQEVDLVGPRYVPSVNVSYSISGSGMVFFASRAPTDLSIQFDGNRMLRSEDGAIVTDHDG